MSWCYVSSEDLGYQNTLLSSFLFRYATIKMETFCYPLHGDGLSTGFRFPGRLWSFSWCIRKPTQANSILFSSTINVQRLLVTMLVIKLTEMFSLTVRKNKIPFFPNYFFKVFSWDVFRLPRLSFALMISFKSSWFLGYLSMVQNTSDFVFW